MNAADFPIMDARGVIDRALRRAPCSTDRAGRALPQDAITKALRKSLRGDIGLEVIDLLKFDAHYQRERAREASREEDQARADAIKRASNMTTTANYIEMYLACRNLKRG